MKITVPNYLQWKHILVKLSICTDFDLFRSALLSSHAEIRFPREITVRAIKLDLLGRLSAPNVAVTSSRETSLVKTKNFDQPII